MEWVLQLVDEIDDALGALKHTLLGIADEMGVFMLAGAGLAAALAALRSGADPTLIGASAVTANLAVLLDRRDRRSAQDAQRKIQPR